jgi:hypothetical protein
MKRLLSAVAVAFISVGAAFTLASCDDYQQSTQGKEAQKQEQMLSDANNSVGMPGILNWTEKRNYKMVYELRDKPNYATYTYLVGMHNELKLICHSQGYGIPESSQYTNPQMLQDTGVSGHYYEVLPQADPNGLYSSPSANGTWIVCVNPTDPTKIGVIRSEPNVLTSPWPLTDER